MAFRLFKRPPPRDFVESRRRPPAKPRTVWVKLWGDGAYEPQCVCGWSGGMMTKLDDATPAHVAALAHGQSCPVARELTSMWEGLVGAPC